MNNSHKKTFMLIALVLIVSIFAVSYAVFTFSKTGDKENTITTGTLILQLDESLSNGVSLVNALPVSDSDGLSSTAFTFKVKNTGTLNANYELSLAQDEAEYTAQGATTKKLATSNIKYSITKNGGSQTTALLSTNSGIMDQTLISPGATNTYTLRLWVKYEADNSIQGQHYYGKLKIKAIQEGHTNYDTGE